MIKLICGFGHHSKTDLANVKLKHSFLELFTTEKYDFVYIKEDGCFLIRVMKKTKDIPKAAKVEE